ncbi:MAG: MOSC domain-containing protein [Acetobacteraceae bacterium]|nr:MOSC domain-containing protein [Acetobacteraceae bacterium]
MRVEHVYRYPVKGLTAEALDEVTLREGEMLPWDRAFALAQGDAPFDPAQPRYLPPRHFLTLKVSARPALLRAAFDSATGTLVLRAPGGEVLRENALVPAGQAQIAAFLTRFLGDDARGTPRFHHVPGHHFADDSERYVSLIGEATLRDLERHVGAPRHRLRFRANLYVSGAAPWAEFGWLGQELQVGSARLRVMQRITRCVATNVNPETAARDAKPVLELRRHFGSAELGVYARVMEGGTVAPGSAVELLGA